MSWLARSHPDRISEAGRDVLLTADDEARVLGLLKAIEPTDLRTVFALHVTGGKTPGIAASFSVEAGDAARGIAAIRILAERLTA